MLRPKEKNNLYMQNSLINSLRMNHTDIKEAVYLWRERGRKGEERGREGEGEEGMVKTQIASNSATQFEDRT